MTKKLFLLLSILFACLPLRAQNNRLLLGNVTEAGTGWEIIGAYVMEVDANGRVVNTTTTNVDGDFAIKIANPKNTLRIKYMGFKTIEMPVSLGKKLKILMEEDMSIMKEVVVTGKKMQNNGIADIPAREVTMAVSRMEFGDNIEGISMVGADDVLQGRIAGLDIVATSGAPGSGSQIRIRGTSTLSSSANPLIVLNDIPFTGEVDDNFDFTSATQDDFADLLCVNVDDIESIDVLKDAASCALYGSQGANGVIKINTKRGRTGKPVVKYSYKMTSKTQPSGMKMLNGDDYTMLMKQAYFNRSLSTNESYDDYSRQEYNYDVTWSEYENFNNNTDWVDEVTQKGWTNDHYLSVSGGGERATFSISAGYLTQSGTNIGQDYTKITHRSQLDYRVSNRMTFTSEFQFTYSDNDKNYDDLLNIAYKKMPNVSVYKQDANGNNTSEYYSIRSDSELDSSQKNLYNPVALAYLAKYNVKNYRMVPTIRLNYYLLDPSEHYLKYSGYVSLDVNNSKEEKFLPWQVSNYDWDNSSVNASSNSSTSSLTIQTENKLEWKETFNEKHNLLVSAALKTSSSTTDYQTISSYGHPSSQLTSAISDAYLSSLTNSTNKNRSLAVTGYFHYSILGRYILSANVRVDGSTKFGKDERWGVFPAVSGKWIISDERFMRGVSKVITLLAIRPGWGITGNQPSSNYLQYSTYSVNSYGYLGNSAVSPTKIQLKNLKWEETTGYNLGIDYEMWNGKITAKVDLYKNRTRDMLWSSYPIATTSGYSSLAYKNVGTMDNQGWELEFDAKKVIEKGKFSFDVNFNLGNNKNTIIDLDPAIMAIYNDAASTIDNGVYLTRIQLNNSNGSIYGFRYKGVYSYSYENYEKALAEGKTCPLVYDADGNMMVDYDGNPKQMYYRYNDVKYAFQGGDAIYEDINHDGSIDEYDVVYLGNSNPKIEGGFGFTLRYGKLSLNVFSNFRFGNKIINEARMEAENMYTDNNQTTTVNWRWRKEGDVTDVPRAVYQQAYNWLGSDRYVENGSFWRLKYISLRYALPNKWLRPIGVSSVSGYLTINNLFCITKYSGTDPEVSVSNFGVATDTSKTPRSRDWMLGLSLTF